MEYIRSIAKYSFGNPSLELNAEGRRAAIVDGAMQTECGRDSGVLPGVFSKGCRASLALLPRRNTPDQPGANHPSNTPDHGTSR